MSNTATTLTSVSRSGYNQLTLVTTDSSLNTYTTVLSMQDNPLDPPNAPVLTTATSGGTVLAGVYTVAMSYTDAKGETVTGPTSTITTTGTTSTITIAAPSTAALQPNATGWYAYVSQVNGATLTRQQTAGSPTAVATPLPLTAPPTSSGVGPPAARGDAPFSQLVRAINL